MGDKIPKRDTDWRKDPATYRQKKLIAYCIDKLEKYAPSVAAELQKQFTGNLRKGTASLLIDKYSDMLTVIKEMEAIFIGEVRTLTDEQKQTLEKIYTRRRERKCLGDKEDINRIKKGNF